MSGTSHYRTSTKSSRYTNPPVLGALLFLLVAIGLVDIGISVVRHHGSHVHGIGNLDVILDGNVLRLELSSPAANIVGFEHTPHSEQEKSVVHKASQTLHAGEALFEFSKKAGCRLGEVHVDNDMIENHHDTPHAETSHGHDNEHDGGHSEFTAAYNFECASPDRLRTIEVMLFSYFPGLEKLHVQLLTPEKQTAATLTSGNNVISF